MGQKLHSKLKSWQWKKTVQKDNEKSLGKQISFLK